MTQPPLGLSMRGLDRMRWYGACLLHGRYLWHPHGRICPVCSRPSAPYTDTPGLKARF